VPATVEHSSEGGSETGKWIAGTTQSITFMDTLKLRLRAKNQLPILYTWYGGSRRAVDERGSRVVGWLVDHPYGMKASEELTEEQSRQDRAFLLLFGVDYAYAELSHNLGSGKSD
ncbi:hypothetical protein EDD16DRAFT_1457582, partial [Pisolithus croceorrhizus]